MQTAHRLAADCTSAKGRAFIRAILDVIDRIERGDPDLLRAMAERATDEARVAAGIPARTR